MNANVSDPAFWSRVQFGFTVTYHYLFPQLTMGLAWFLVYWKWCALRTGEEKYNHAVRFWVKIFGLNFAVGVVTGIPMEFQFGTNWAGFSRYAGGVVGQTLAMEPRFKGSECPCHFFGLRTFHTTRRRDRAHHRLTGDRVGSQRSA